MKKTELKMLRLDGEIWLVAPGEGNEENTVKARKAGGRKAPGEEDWDKKAIAAGMDLIQTSYGGDFYHEIRQLS